MFACVEFLGLQRVIAPFVAWRVDVDLGTEVSDVYFTIRSLNK